MRVAVITPYYKEAPGVLESCLQGVARQTYRQVRHFMVADGFPQKMPPGVEHIVLSAPHADNGGYARCIGARAAIDAGFDAISFLDADNWFRPDHIATVTNTHRQTGAVVCTTSRTLHRLDGSLLRAEGIKWTDFADTSCLCFFRGSFEILKLWAAIPRVLAPLADRVICKAVERAGLSLAHSSATTVAFRTQYAGHYLFHNEEPPPGAKRGDDPEMLAALEYLQSLDQPALRALFLGPWEWPAPPDQG